MLTQQASVLVSALSVLVGQDILVFIPGAPMAHPPPAWSWSLELSSAVLTMPVERGTPFGSGTPVIGAGPALSMLTHGD